MIGRDVLGRSAVERCNGFVLSRTFSAPKLPSSGKTATMSRQGGGQCVNEGMAPFYGQFTPLNCLAAHRGTRLKLLSTANHVSISYGGNVLTYQRSMESTISFASGLLSGSISRHLEINSARSARRPVHDISFSTTSSWTIPPSTGGNP